MKRFWFRFAGEIYSDLPSGIILGCGVTAESKQAAIQIIKNIVFDGNELPEIIEFREDVDISTLDRGHVIPNMGNVFKRGIWFPLGYDVKM